MKFIFALCVPILGIFIGIWPIGDVSAAASPWRFDFGPVLPMSGHQLITIDTLYTDKTGFGWEPQKIELGQIADSPISQSDHAAAVSPIAFSIAVPEGDYRVTVRLGNARSDSKTTVMAETRRLMLDNIVAAKGQIVIRSFTVNVRNAHLLPPPPNAPGGMEVRLNDRELLSYTWDDKLTLEFSGAERKVTSVDVVPVHVPRLFLLGDSTVTDQMRDPNASWGQMLPRFFGPDIAIANHAESGETLKSFLTGLRLDKVLSQIRPGDWVFIQFGHNDEKSQWPQTYVAAENTYRSYLRIYIDETRRLGAIPVLVTSPQRRLFDAQGHITNSHGAYPDAVRAVASEMNVSVIDLGAMSAALYEALGAEWAPLAFAQQGRDVTHNNNYGAYELARCVVKAIQDMSLPLAGYLAPGIEHFDPSNPDPPDAVNF